MQLKCRCLGIYYSNLKLSYLNQWVTLLDMELRVAFCGTLTVYSSLCCEHAIRNKLLVYCFFAVFLFKLINISNEETSADDTSTKTKTTALGSKSICWAVLLFFWFTSILLQCTKGKQTNCIYPQQIFLPSLSRQKQ